MLRRINITRQEIEMVVHSFYIKVRAHPVLGPIFATKIESTPQVWKTHEEKIVRFWANAILYEKEYSGNPMAVHMKVSALKSQHFNIWLDLFEKTLNEVLDERAANEFNLLARRIGRGLEMGLSYTRDKAQEPPSLL